MAREFICSKTEPVVETTAGRLRGFKLDGIYTFHGIKYADAKRFHSPVATAPWEGVKDALSYGFVAPMPDMGTPNGELMVPHRYWPMDENCQFLNIWTASLEANDKKPVMVWLHGGGFFAGSSIEQQAYDGGNMAQKGDVVVVSLNHRLNVLGYLDLSPFGEKYKNSANAGNEDIVAALRWVRDNIAGFGGDPDNVTIFGQSGGGMKVWSLMQTPEADGLFHKGIVQSGTIKGDDIIDMSKQDGTSIVTAMLKELSLGVDEIEKLETIPYMELVGAYGKASIEVSKSGAYVGNAPMPNYFYKGDPLVVGFTEHAKTIPVMIGTVFGEFSFVPALTKEEKADSAYVDKRLHERYGEATDKLIDEFKKAYPDKHISDLLFLDSLFRSPTIDFALKKAEYTQAPTYSYMFSYEFPYDDGHVAWHCSEIPYTFHNANLVPVCNEPGVTDKLEEQIFGAWINFARTGNPGNELLPQWDANVSGKENVMIFDKECVVKTNYDHELIKLHEEAAPPFRFSEDQDIQH